MNAKLFALCCVAGLLWGTAVRSAAKSPSPLQNPYAPLSGGFSGEKVAQSPDPLVNYRWDRVQASDSLECYELTPQHWSATPQNAVTSTKRGSWVVKAPCDLCFDFGQVNAAWLEFESSDLDGEVEMSISEYTAPAVVNAGAQHPKKTAVPVRYGNTYRLELNPQLYEGVRFGWIHVRSLRQPVTISKVRLVCQIRPTNYEGSFQCSDTLLTRIWYTGAYTVKLNLLQEYFGAILMERSDRHSWTGDAHPAQAASLVAFGNYDFVRTNLFYTSTQFNGIASYSLYWVLSLIDYYDYTGDTTTLDALTDNACAKLQRAFDHFGTNPDLQFHGWDERLGAGFENPNCPEAQHTYQMLTLRTWREFSRVMAQRGRVDLAQQFETDAAQKATQLQKRTDWSDSYGVFAATEAINAGVPTPSKQQTLWQQALSDRLQRVSYSPFNQYFILQAMARMGRYAEALTTIDDCWGGQIRYGGTTFFEVFRPSWNHAFAPCSAPVNNQCGYTSLTHPWSAGVTCWLSEEVLGIQPLTPGFATFRVAPYLSDRLTWVKGAVPTPHGTIHWAFDIDKAQGELTVPEGCRAQVALPTGGRRIESASCNGKPMNLGLETDHGVEVGFLTAGTYRFKVKYSGDRAVTPTESLHYLYATDAAQDSVTGGNWTERYGSKGYLLFNYAGEGQDLYRWPQGLDAVKFGKRGNGVIPSAEAASDRRALVSETSSERRLGLAVTRDPIPCDQTMTLDLPLRTAGSYQVALYFVDWQREGRESAVEVFDLESRQLLMPVQRVAHYGEGRYVIFRFDRPVRLRINQVRGSNAALGGVFFD